MHGDGPGVKFAITIVKATEADLAEMGPLGREKFRIINYPVTRVGLTGVNFKSADNETNSVLGIANM